MTSIFTDTKKETNPYVTPKDKQKQESQAKEVYASGKAQLPERPNDVQTATEGMNAHKIAEAARNGTLSAHDIDMIETSNLPESLKAMARAQKSADKADKAESTNKHAKKADQKQEDKANSSNEHEDKLKTN